MGDSLESNLMLVVPSSIEDNSEPSAFVSSANAFGATADNPLALTSNLFQSTSPSKTNHEEHPQSFSCLQLSGRVTASPSGVSDLDVDDPDIIPPTPPVLHIDISNTPSVGLSRMSNGSSVGSLMDVEEDQDGSIAVNQDSMVIEEIPPVKLPSVNGSSNSPEASGSMSPELISSSDISSDVLASSLEKRTSGSGKSSDCANLSTTPGDSSTAYDADTESYSQCENPFSKSLGEEEKQNSFGSYLQSCVSSHVEASPLILTANTPAESGKWNKNDEDERRSGQDVKEKRNDEGSRFENEEDDVNIKPRGNDSQLDTQEDLNLHLTFSQSQSQLFDVPEFSSNDQDAEESQNIKACSKSPSVSTTAVSSNIQKTSPRHNIMSSNPFSPGESSDISDSQKLLKLEVSPTSTMPSQLTPTQELLSATSRTSHIVEHLTTDIAAEVKNFFARYIPGSVNQTEGSNSKKKSESHDGSLNVTTGDRVTQNEMEPMETETTESHNATAITHNAPANISENLIGKDHFDYESQEAQNGNIGSSQGFKEARNVSAPRKMEDTNRDESPSLKHSSEIFRINSQDALSSFSQGSSNINPVESMSQGPEGENGSDGKDPADTSLVDPTSSEPTASELQDANLPDKLQENQDSFKEVDLVLVKESQEDESKVDEVTADDVSTHDSPVASRTTSNDAEVPDSAGDPIQNLEQQDSEDDSTLPGAGNVTLDPTPLTNPQNIISSLPEDAKTSKESLAKDIAKDVDSAPSNVSSCQAVTINDSLDVPASSPVVESSTSNVIQTAKILAPQDSQNIGVSQKSTYIDDNQEDLGESVSVQNNSSDIAPIQSASQEQEEDMEFMLENAETQPFISMASSSQDSIVISSAEEMEESQRPSHKLEPGHRASPAPTWSDIRESQRLEDKQVEIRELVDNLLVSIEDQDVLSNNQDTSSKVVGIETEVDEKEILTEKSASPAQQTEVAKDLQKTTKETLVENSEGQKTNKKYDFHSQLSHEIQLKSKFTSPTGTTAAEKLAELRGFGRKKLAGRLDQMDVDNNNNPAGDGQNAEELDKSSDTLPVDDNSGHSSSVDLLLSPNKGERTYRVTKYTVETIEELLEGKVVQTKTYRKKLQTYITDHDPTASHSSNGSGYLADTSSMSRTSSDSSTQTQMGQSHSPGHRLHFLNEPSLSRSLSGTSSSSTASLGSRDGFLIPQSGIPVAIKPPRRIREERRVSDPNFDDKTGRRSPAAGDSPVGNTPDTSAMTSKGEMMGSPELKQGRVILTPLSLGKLSTEPEGGSMWGKSSAEVATPPTANINPVSVSTPMPHPQKDDSTSDITTSHSPEIPFPSESMETTHSASLPLDNSAVVRDTQSSPQRLPLNEGIPVMARAGRENFYYPGIIRKQDPTSGKCSVYFEDDGRERLIREVDILLIDMLPVGQEVYAQSDSEDPSDWYSAGNVLSYWREDTKRGYIVEKTEGDSQTKYTRRYARRQVIVKHENLSNALTILRVQPIASPTTADVSLDNVVDGGRRRGRRSDVGDSPAHSACGTPSPRTTRTPRSTRKRVLVDSQSSGSSSCVPYPSTQKSKRAKLTYGSTSTPSPSSKRGGKKSKTMAVIYPQSAIFENCGFLLTSTTGKDRPSSEFDSPPCEGSVGVYDREIIRKQILAGGGIISKTFTQLMNSERNQLYVISDNYCRTTNYFNALAAGISCLSYLWIGHSCISNKLHPTQSYLLPAGFSLRQQRAVERSDSPVQPLSGLRVSLHMKTLATWKSLLSIAGCHTVSTSGHDAKKDDCHLSCDVVVADKWCSNVIIERARFLNIPVVTIEWVIQCLINGERLPYDSHPEFKVGAV